MPGFPTDGFLLDVSAAGAALAGSLLLGTIAARILRAVLSGRRARAEQAIRPMVLAVVSGGAKLQVSILGKEMTRDEVVAGLKSEGEVNVANWTYTANDAIVGRFQDVSDVTRERKQRG